MIVLVKLLMIVGALVGGAAALRTLARRGAALRRAPAGPARPTAIDLDRCPVCGIYVTATQPCGTAGCPRGGAGAA